MYLTALVTLFCSVIVNMKNIIRIIIKLIKLNIYIYKYNIKILGYTTIIILIRFTLTGVNKF